jgi:hypothetical protein
MLCTYPRAASGFAAKGPRERTTVMIFGAALRHGLGSLAFAQRLRDAITPPARATANSSDASR